MTWAWVHYFHVHYAPTTAILSQQSAETLHCSNPTINMRSVPTFIVREIQTHSVGVPYITIKKAWQALSSKVCLEPPSWDEKQMKHFEAEPIPLLFCNSICHSQRLILSKSAFLHDLHHREQDERVGSGFCPLSSLCQGSGSTEALRTPANWE